MHPTPHGSLMAQFVKACVNTRIQEATQ